MTNEITPSTLYVVATPIGNIADLSPRAIEVLKSVDLILCEDTRHSGPLLSLFNIKTPTQTLHEFNESTRSQYFIEQLKDGKSIALISDAGTPLISDPGYQITALCHQNGIKVSPIPGCSALITALSASGLATDSFTFYGFLPAKSKQRKEKYQSIISSKETSIFYESTHRIIESLEDLISILGGEREICIARELTKQFETIKKDSAANILAYLNEDSNHKKGEFVLIISKGEAQESTVDAKILALASELKSSLKPKDIAKIIAKVYAVDKKEIYDYLINSK